MPTDTSRPTFLDPYADVYAADPRAAAKAAFADAKFGLFLHYGLYSVLGRHEWVQLKEKIHVAEMEKVASEFTAENFNADAIADLALAAGMKYINITTRHHDSFSLWPTEQNDFHSVAACGRDLVGELAKACNDRGLALHLYYSHGRDWRHPHAPNNDHWGGSARPKYDTPEPVYATGDEHDLSIYVEFMKAQITELITWYPTIASIWLDGIMVPLSDRSKDPCPQPPRQPENGAGWRCQELYDHIHATNPHCLVSYKQGLLGTEDFWAPEHSAIDAPTDKTGEICTTLCNEPRSWGYYKDAGPHLTADQVWQTLTTARQRNYNLLLNTGPLPDGSIDPEDEATLRTIGTRIAAEGFPGE